MGKQTAASSAASPGDWTDSHGRHAGEVYHDPYGRRRVATAPECHADDGTVTIGHEATAAFSAYIDTARPRATSTRVRPRRRGAGRPRARTATRSSAKSGDSGGESEEPEPPSSGRRCEACGADISGRRAGARTCDALCRKRLSRGNVARDPLIAPPAQPLEDVIDEIAHKRHLAWSSPERDSVEIDELQKYLVDLYSVLRRQRARGPLPEFQGNIASYDFDVRAARQFRQPRRRGSSKVATTQFEAVAA